MDAPAVGVTGLDGTDGPAVLCGPDPAGLSSALRRAGGGEYARRPAGQDAGTAGMPGSPIDLDRAERAVADLLDALGADRGADGLAATPAWVCRAYAELLTPAPFEVATFPNDEGYDELVVASGVPFCSLCAHHLLPFSGVAHVGYLPGARLAGLSTLARVVEHSARRLQPQERLTAQVAGWLGCHLAPRGRGRGHRGRARLHVAAGSAGRRGPDGHLGDVRADPRRPPHPGRVPGLYQDVQMTGPRSQALIPPPAAVPGPRERKGGQARLVPTQRRS